ncbi:MAG: glutathione S-transferase family protein [Alphaproteobacteria bacterium]|nr:glutathione S-transferase family protein [Alphaproteobacteria bacterium]
MSTELHLVIGNKAYSSWSMRPWIAMTANGLKFRETVICLGQDNTASEIKKYSASGKVPYLIHGDIRVWDSLAIIEYLAEAFYDKPWWPTDPQARAVARAISAEMHSGFQGLRQNMPMNVRRSHPGKGAVPEALADIARISAIWTECRQRFGAKGPYLFGTFCNADAMYAPVVTRFKTYGVALDPVCRAYADAMLDHPALKQWYADAAKESWVVEKYELA